MTSATATFYTQQTCNASCVKINTRNAVPGPTPRRAQPPLHRHAALHHSIPRHRDHSTAAAWVAFALFMLAGISDAFDGLLARWLSQRTTLGLYLDPSPTSSSSRTPLPRPHPRRPRPAALRHRAHLQPRPRHPAHRHAPLRHQHPPRLPPWPLPGKLNTLVQIDGLVVPVLNHLAFAFPQSAFLGDCLVRAHSPSSRRCPAALEVRMDRRPAHQHRHLYPPAPDRQHNLSAVRPGTPDESLIVHRSVFQLLGLFQRRVGCTRRNRIPLPHCWHSTNSISSSRATIFRDGCLQKGCHGGSV